MNSKTYGPIRQIAYIVEDLDAAIRHWTAFAGIGPLDGLQEHQHARPLPRRGHHGEDERGPVLPG